MTEAEWMEGADPLRMLAFLEGKGSDRKWQLFAVSCCCRILPLLPDEPNRLAVEVSERIAEGEASEGERMAAMEAHVAHAPNGGEPDPGDDGAWALYEAAGAVWDLIAQTHEPYWAAG